MIRVAKMLKLNKKESSLRAFADIVLSEKVLIKNVRVFEAEKGLFAVLPQQQSKEGKWFEIVSFLDKKLKEELQKEVIKAYEA